MRKFLSALASVLTIIMPFAMVHPAAAYTGITVTNVPTANASPGKLITGPDNNAWFIEANAGRIATVDSHAAITEFPLPDTSNNIADLTNGPDGNIWFIQYNSDNDTHAIGRLSLTGTYTIYPLPNPNEDPGYITAGPDGALWFTEGSFAKVGRIDTSGHYSFFDIPGGSGNYGRSIVGGPDGALWMSGFSNTNGFAPNVMRMTTDGNFTTYPAPRIGFSLTLGPDGNIWYATYPQYVGVIHVSDGSITEYQTPTAPSTPSSLINFGDGNLWFIESPSSGHNNLARVTPAGAITEYPLAGGFRELDGLALGGDGNFWMSASIENQLLSAPQIPNASGPNMVEYRLPANPNGASPRAITSTTTGGTPYLWMTNNASHGGYSSIIRTTLDGRSTTTLAMPNQHSLPQELTAGPDGAVWFTENGANNSNNPTTSIGRIDIGGNITEFPLTGQVSANTITPGPDGALWFTQNDVNPPYTSTIGRITTAGAISYFPMSGTPRFPVDITTGPDGALWFALEDFNTQGGAIGRMATDGTFTAYPLSGSAPSPHGIAAGPDGALWFTEIFGDKIGRITTTGAITEYPIPSNPSFPPNPTEITAGPDNAMYFVETGASQNNQLGIGRISMSGIVASYPPPTNTNVNLSDITLGPDSNLWFVENGLNQLGKFTPPVAGPANLSAPSPTKNPALTWDAVAGATSYNVYRDGQLLGTSTSTNFTDTAAMPGSHTYYVTAVTAAEESAPSNQITVMIVQDPAITSASSTTANVGSSLNFQVTTTGIPMPAISETGALPAGVSLTDNGDGTADLAGVPAPGTAGPYPLTLKADNGSGNPATQNFTLTVTNNPVAPSFVSAGSDTETFGVPFSFTIQTNGNPAPKLTKTGTLPAGVTFKDNCDGTATLSGTPSNAAIGVYNLTLKATNASGTSTQAFTLTINKAPVITAIGNKAAQVGQPYSIGVTSKGYTPPVLHATGLPAGLSLTDHGDGTGTISGTPSAGTGGSHQVTVTATNATGTAIRTFTLKVNEGPAITSASSATATIGSAFSFTVTASGFPKPSLSKTGTLPKGITFSAATGTFSGTPKAGSAGNYPITITAKNSSGTVTQSFTITVN